MAVTYLAGNTAEGASTSTITIAHTCNAAATILFFAIDFNYLNAPTSASVTWNGSPMTPVFFLKRTSYTSAGLWYIVTPTTGNKNFVVTFSGGDTTPNYAACIASYSGGTTVDTPVGTEGDGTDIHTGNIESATGDLVVGAAGNNDTTLAEDVAHTERQYIRNADGSACSIIEEDGAATVNLGWTGGASAEWVCGGVSVNPTAAGGRTTRNTASNQLGQGYGMNLRQVR